MRLTTVLQFLAIFPCSKDIWYIPYWYRGFFCPNRDKDFSYVHNLKRHQEKCVKCKDDMPDIHIKTYSDVTKLPVVYPFLTRDSCWS